MTARRNPEIADLLVSALSRDQPSLELRAGTYRVTRPIILQGNVAVRGRGLGVTVLESTVEGPLFVIEDDDGSANAVTVEGLSVIHRGSWLAEIESAGSVFIRNLQATGLQSGIAVRDGTCVEIDGVDLREFSRAGGTGILIDGGNEHWIEGCVIEGLHNAPVAGIRVIRSGGTFLDTVSIIRCGTGLLIDPESGNVEWGTASNLKCDTCESDGIRIAPQGGTVRGMSFDQCWSASNGANGVFVAGGIDGIQFSDSKILNNCEHGALIEDGATSVEFANCNVAGNSRGGAGRCNGLTVRSAQGVVSKFAVRGGAYGCADGHTGYQRYGIDVRGTLNELVIDGTPNCTGNTRGTLNDGATTQFKRIGPIMGICNTWLPVRTASTISPNLLSEDANGAPHEHVRLIGAGAVQNILYGWSGRTITFLCDPGVSFIYGGNVATPLACPTARRVVAEFDGARWWLS